jgi:RNA-directed DNA polymerase
MVSFRQLISALADAFLSGSFDKASLLQRGQICIGESPGWLQSLANKLSQQEKILERHNLIALIRSHPGFNQAILTRQLPNRIAHYYLPETTMRTTPQFVSNGLPQIHTVAELNQFLQIEDVPRLNWLADNFQTLHKQVKPSLSHYHYRWQGKKPRLLEIPKQQLKTIQRQIAQTILKSVPTHSAIHGFKKGCSIMSFTAPHLGKRWVLKLDLKSFFVTIGFSRLYGLFSFLGYPKAVSRYLALLCSNQVPEAVLKPRISDWTVRKQYQQRHLPQGAPSSPVLANLIAYRLDCRLTGLAASIGATYTRYADDLLLSGTKHADASRLVPLIGHIVADEGFLLNYRKTRIMGRGQQQKATGIIINQRQNIDRKSFDQFKALLHNCIVNGVSSQQDRYQMFDPCNQKLTLSRIQGQLAYFKMVNPCKAQKLTKLFDKIIW